MVWKEKPGQPGPKELGRPTKGQIPSNAWKTAPVNILPLEGMIADGMNRSEAISAIESEYKTAMGISPNEAFSILPSPDGSLWKADLTGLAHVMLKREESRERYVHYFRDVIENPFEVLLTEYKAGNKTKYRKKHIGLYQADSKRNGLVIVAEETKDGWVMWTVTQTKRKTIDRLRRGVKVLSPKESNAR